MNETKIAGRDIFLVVPRVLVTMLVNTVDNKVVFIRSELFMGMIEDREITASQYRDILLEQEYAKQN